MAKSKIEWCDAVWNPTTGCSKVSAGCKHCYAESMSKQLTAMGQPKYGRGFLPTFHPDALDLPLKTRKPTRFFVNSMSDLFHEALTNEQIAAVFGVMAAAPRHVFMVLTKRATRMCEWFEWINAERLLAGMEMAKIAELSGTIAAGISMSCSPQAAMRFGINWPCLNVWLGVSVENQRAADERIPELLQTPAAVRFLSCEPILNEINVAKWLGVNRDATLQRRFISWVICGCESGPGRRPFDEDWARSLRDQCVDTGVPFFYKQGLRDGKVVSMPELDGKVWNQLPERRQ